MSDRLDVQRDELDRILEHDWSGSTDHEVLHGACKLAHLVYKDADAKTWAELTDRIRNAFGTDDTTLAGILGIDATTVPPVNLPKSRPEFRSLVKKGWLDGYLDYTSESESPAQFHFGAVVGAIAGCLKRQPLIGWEAMPTYPNMYILLVGPTGSRKTTAALRAVKTVQEACKELYVLPAEGSPQGFARALKRRYAETGTCADGLVVSEEYSVLFGGDKYKEALAQWFTQWYDCPSLWERALSGEEFFSFEKPYVSIVGCSNKPWLKAMPASAITGGFFPRHHIFDAPGPRHRKAIPLFNTALLADLASALRTNLSCVQPIMRLNDTSIRYLNNWYTNDLAVQEALSSDEQTSAWFSRKQAALMKLACIWQIADGGPADELCVEWLEQSRGVLDWIDFAVSDVYRSLGTTQEGEPQEAVLAYIESHGGRTSEAIMSRALRNKYRKPTILAALAMLESARLLRRSTNVVEGVVWTVTREGC